MSIRTFLFNPSRVNTQYLQSELKPGTFYIHFLLMVGFVAVTAIPEVKRVTGISTLLMLILILPHCIGYWASLFAVKKYGYNYNYHYVFVMVHVNLFTSAALVMAGHSPLTPLWVFFFFYIGIVVYAFGLQPYVVLLIITAGMSPFLLHDFFTWGRSGSYLGVCSICSLAGVMEYTFLAFIIGHSRKIEQIETDLQHEKQLSDQKERIWDDIHDGMGSHLTMATLGCRVTGELLNNPYPDMSNVKRLVSEILENTNNALDEMRQAVYFAQSNSDFSILTILQDVRESFCGAYDAAGIAVMVHSDGLHGNAGILTAPQTAYALRRILQEIFTNILRHSKATTVDVRVQIIEKKLHISIQDNGIGYGLQEKVVHGNGIKSIQRRAQSIDAVFAIDSRTRAGTCITLSLDCNNSPAIGG